MSDISSNSSFELISNSNRSDVDEQSIGSGNSANEIQNTNSLDVVESKVVEEEAPDVLAEQNPISLKKTTPDRKSNDIRGDLDQSSHSDNTNTRLMEETRRKLHEQKLYDAEARGFRLGLCVCFMLMICFLLIGALVFLSSTSEHHNASPIVKKFNVTMELPKKDYNFPEEKKQKIMDRVRKISDLRNSVQGKTRFTQLPEDLWDKFIPDYSRFQGVYEFLQLTQTNGTIYEDYLYYSTPRFRVDKGKAFVNFFLMDTSEQVKFWIEDCDFTSENCHTFTVTLCNGDLYIREKFTLNSHEFEFIRVYFIPYPDIA